MNLTRKNWKKKTRDGYSSTLKPFLTDHGSRLINTIEDEELPPYWLRHKHPQTQKNYYRNFRAFFNAAQKKRLLVQNPMTPHDAPKVPRRGRPIILTLEQVQLLVKAAMNPKYDKLLVFVTLGLFGGLRPSEIENGLMGRSLKTAPHLKPMTWESIKLDAEDERDWVDVGGRGKQSSERYVELSPNAISLLKFAKEKGLSVFPEKNSANLWKALRRSIGLQGQDKWQDDIMRHTAVSYRYRCNPFTMRKGEGKRSQLSSIFGHSEYIQSTHYKNAGTTMADARAFWRIGAPSWKHDNPKSDSAGIKVWSLSSRKKNRT